VEVDFCKVAAAIADMLRYPQVLNALCSLDLTHREIYRHFRELFEGFLGHYTRTVGKRRWIDKTPGYYKLLPFLDLLFEGEPQYVFIVRHPLDTVCSMEDMSAKYASFNTEDPDIVRLKRKFGEGRHVWAKYWNEVYEQVDAFRRLCPGRCHLVEYERLVEETEPVVNAVVSFLGEDPGLLHLDEAFLRPPGKGYQDDKILTTTHVHRESVGSSRRLSPREARELWEILLPTAKKFRFEPASDWQKTTAFSCPGQATLPAKSPSDR